MDLSLEKISKILNKNDNFCILTHQYPDGDTLGSAFALCIALQNMGKKAKVVNDEAFPEKYNFLQSKLEIQNFKPNFFICVDIANKKLLGPNLKELYANDIDISIDHHLINEDFAKFRYVNSSAAATGEIIYELLKIMNVKINKHIANCIYTAIATDTGCFKYKNTTSNTHRVASDMIDFGADVFDINRLMFDSKSKEQFMAERYILDSMEFYFNNRVAVVYVMLDMLEKTGAKDTFVDGIAGIPKQIIGVDIGITFRQKEDKVFKISVRTKENIDASLICSHFGGGGHANAAGCTLCGNLDEIKFMFLEYAKNFLK